MNRAPILPVGHGIMAQAGACPFPLRSALTHPCGTWSAHGLVRTWPFTRSLRAHVGLERRA